MCKNRGIYAISSSGLNQVLKLITQLHQYIYDVTDLKYYETEHLHCTIQTHLQNTVCMC